MTIDDLYASVAMVPFSQPWAAQVLIQSKSTTQKPVDYLRFPVADPTKLKRWAAIASSALTIQLAQRCTEHMGGHVCLHVDRINTYFQGWGSFNMTHSWPVVPVKGPKQMACLLHFFDQGELLVVGLLELGFAPWTWGIWRMIKVGQSNTCHKTKGPPQQTRIIIQTRFSTFWYRSPRFCWCQIYVQENTFTPGMVGGNPLKSIMGQ